MPLFTGCKKGSSGPAVSRLHKIFIDGKLDEERTYYGDKKLHQIIYYNVAGTSIGTDEFLYNAKGILKEIHGYNGAGKLSRKEFYYTDSKDRFTNMEWIAQDGADSGKIISKRSFTYTNNQITKEAWLDLVSGVEVSYRAYDWYPNGNMKTQKDYDVLVPSPHLQYECAYSKGDSVTAAVTEGRGYPINFSLFFLASDQMLNKIYGGIAVTNEYEDEINKRVYDNKGNLISQTVVRTYTIPVKPKHVQQMTFEYLEL